VTVSDDELVRFGKQLFGRPTRLAVAVHLSDRHEPSYLTEIASALGLPASAVAQELANLTDLGLLERVDVDGSRRVYYMPTASPWWEVLSAASRVLLRERATSGEADTS
jgi:DNA-binding transcriptional ArsR family regulator